MNAELGRAAFRMGMFVAFPAMVLLVLLPWGSAESIVSLMSLVVGLAFLGTVTVLVRRR